MVRSTKFLMLGVAGIFVVGGAQAELANFDFNGNVVSTADADGSAAGAQFTFNSPSATMMFAGFNDPQSNLDRVDFTLRYSISSDIVVDVSQNVSPQNGFGDTLRATAGFTLGATGTGAMAENADSAVSGYDIFFTNPGDDQAFAPTVTTEGVFTGALTNAERDEFLVNAMVPITVESDLSNRFQAATEIAFDSFSPFEISGSLELTFITSAATPDPQLNTVPLPGSILLLMSGMLLTVRRSVSLRWL